MNLEELYRELSSEFKTFEIRAENESIEAYINERFCRKIHIPENLNPVTVSIWLPLSEMNSFEDISSRIGSMNDFRYWMEQLGFSSQYNLFPEGPGAIYKKKLEKEGLIWPVMITLRDRISPGPHLVI